MRNKNGLKKQIEITIRQLNYLVMLLDNRLDIINEEEYYQDSILEKRMCERIKEHLEKNDEK